MNSKKIKKAAAIQYDHVKDLAPRVVAKGQGKMAEKIVSLARQHDIPLVADSRLVQLLDALDINTAIPPELYQAVAEVLVYIYRMNGKMHGPDRQDP